MPTTTTLVGGLFGLGVQFYVNGVRKLPAFRNPWEHVLMFGAGAVFANYVANLEEKTAAELEGASARGGGVVARRSRPMTTQRIAGLPCERVRPTREPGRAGPRAAGVGRRGGARVVWESERGGEGGGGKGWGGRRAGTEEGMRLGRFLNSRSLRRAAAARCFAFLSPSVRAWLMSVRSRAVSAQFSSPSVPPPRTTRSALTELRLLGHLLPLPSLPFFLPSPLFFRCGGPWNHE